MVNKYEAKIVVTQVAVYLILSVFIIVINFFLIKLITNSLGPFDSLFSSIEVSYDIFVYSYLFVLILLTLGSICAYIYGNSKNINSLKKSSIACFVIIMLVDVVFIYMVELF